LSTINKSKLSFELIIPIILDSIKLLLKNPILILPKLLIAILYGFGTLIAVDLSKQLFSFQAFTSEQFLTFDFTNLFISCFFLLGLTISAFFIDLFFSGFYPILVSLALKKKLAFKEAFNLFKPKLVQIFLAGMIIWVLLTIISITEAAIIIFFNLSDIGLILSLIITFVFAFIFYFIYPKLVFENLPVQNVFTDSFAVSLKNKKLVFVLSLIPFSVSIIKFVLAYFSDSTLFLVLFWGLVFITGLVYSIHAVVNQLAYIKISNFKK